MTVPVEHVLALSAILFALGAVGAIARRNAVVVLMSLELMMGAIHLVLVGFSRFHADPAAQVFALLVVAASVAEVAIGLAIVLALFRTGSSVDVEDASVLKW